MWIFPDTQSIDTNQITVPRIVSGQTTSKQLYPTGRRVQALSALAVISTARLGINQTVTNQ